MGQLEDCIHFSLDTGISIDSYYNSTSRAAQPKRDGARQQSKTPAPVPQFSLHTYSSVVTGALVSMLGLRPFPSAFALDNASSLGVLVD
jgi:hypothetical protein